MFSKNDIGKTVTRIQHSYKENGKTVKEQRFKDTLVEFDNKKKIAIVHHKHSSGNEWQDFDVGVPYSDLKKG